MPTHSRHAALTLLVKVVAALALNVAAFLLLTITAFACDAPEEAICVRSQMQATSAYFVVAFLAPWVLCSVNVGRLAASQDEVAARRVWLVATIAWSVLVCADVLYLPILAR